MTYVARPMASSVARLNHSLMCKLDVFISGLLRWMDPESQPGEDKASTNRPESCHQTG